MIYKTRTRINYAIQKINLLEQSTLIDIYRIRLIEFMKRI